MNLNAAVSDKRGCATAWLDRGKPAISYEDVVLRPLQDASEIARVLHLREEIDLSVHAAAGAEFIVLEKKETSAAVSSPSSSKVTRLGRSGSFQWAMA